MTKDVLVDAFGKQWNKFNQTEVPEEELKAAFEKYFSIFPWSKLPPNSVGADIGCGSGRWAKFVAPRVAKLYCIDPSSLALKVAETHNLAFANNCMFIEATAENLPIADNSLDFAYSLGVLHHTENVRNSLNACTKKLKPGAPFLLYLYYSLDNKPKWQRWVLVAHNLVRYVVSRLPLRVKVLITDFIALTVYWPLSRIALLAEKAGMNVSNFLLAAYRDKSFYTLRTDSLDRFGTHREHRFSRIEIEAMMKTAGLTDIAFREEEPFWCSVGFKEIHF